MFRLTGETPKIVVSFSAAPTREQVAQIVQSGKGRGEWAELRLDLYPGLPVAETAASFAEIPLIGTIRSAAEGGKWEGSESERQALFESIVPFVSVIDIELSSHALLSEVIAATHAAGKGAMVSYHQFERMPEEAEMTDILHRAKGCGADLIKIAAAAQTLGEVRRLARFTLAHADEPVVTLAMGAVGALSRLFFPALGSPLSYAYIGEPTAPGQFSYLEMAAWFDRLYPVATRKE